MSRVALALQYATRLWAKATQAFWRWVISAFLVHKAQSCGSAKAQGFGRFVNVGGLIAGQRIHLNAGAHWVCDRG